MLSPSTYTVSRQAPPMRPRSLEGLERVIPPHTPISPVRPTLRLDKPLPELPTKSLPETPDFIGSTAWSDNSSTVDSFNDDDEDDARRQSSVSTESYPVFVRSGSDDLADLVDHPSVSTLDRSPIEPFAKPGTSSLALTTFLAEDHSGRPPNWANRVGPNHYFREKKWDFFPELATPSALQQNSPHLPAKPRKKDTSRLNFSAFDFSSKNRSRWTSTDNKSSLTLAHDVRNSIRSYVQRRLSRNSVERDKPPKRKPRPATAPSEYPPGYTPSQRAAPSTSASYRSDRGGSTAPQTPLEAGDQIVMTQLSLSTTTSSTGEISKRQQRPIPYHRKKQLAVPITPYQKYGAAIWDKSGREKRISYRQHHNVRFPKYRKKNTPKKGFVSSATPPSRSPPCSQLQQSTRDYVRALQDGTSQVLVAIDGARKKMIGSRVDRRHTQLKAQIRLVGPVNPYTTYGREDPWV